MDPDYVFHLTVYEKHLRDREVDDCGVLFHKEVVLGESFDAKDEVRRQFGQLEPFEKILFVGFVFLNANESKVCTDIFSIEKNKAFCGNYKHCLWLYQNVLFINTTAFL